MLYLNGDDIVATVHIKNPNQTRNQKTNQKEISIEK